MKKEQHQCEGKVFEDYSSHRCRNNASYERDGKWYCKLHDPVAIKEKEAKRAEKWDKEYNNAKERTRRRTAEIAYCKDLTTEELESKSTNHREVGL